MDEGGDHAARMIYLDSQSPSLNDSRPGATGCWVARGIIVCGGLRAIAMAAV